MLRSFFFLALSALCFAAWALTGCYNPHPAHFQCGDAPHVCPDGQSCISGCCGGPPCGLTGDGGPQEDGPTSPPDGPAANGCADGRGFSIGGGMWACPGKVKAGDLRKRCAATFSLPQVSGISFQDCAGLSGFYVAGVVGADPQNPPGAGIACQWTNQPLAKQRFIFGCGTGSGTYDAGPCGNFSRAAHCDPGDGTIVGPTDWDCPLSAPPQNADIDNIASTSAADGVLCWHP